MKRNLARRDRTLSQYGLDKNQFDVMLEKQNGMCKMCSEKIVDRPVVDHCHATGLVRGILHSNCNVLLGMAKDSTGILLKAVDYLNAQY